jgi:hypothetical protein
VLALTSLLAVATFLAQTADRPVYDVDPAVAFLGTLLSVGIGAWIGSTKNRTLLGAVLGFFCGCIGWIIMALLPKKSPY